MTDYTPKTFKLDKKVCRALELAAKREDRSQTAIVERAIRLYVTVPAEAPAQPAPAAQPEIAQ